VSNSRCGIFVPVEVRFKWTNTLPRENALFLGSLGQRVQLDGLQRFIAGYQPPTKPARNGTYAPWPRRLATKSWGSGRKSNPGYLGALPSKQTKAKRESRHALRIAPVILTFNQRKNAFIKAADLARYDYQFLVLACKLSLPNMRSPRMLAAGLAQLVQGLAKRLSIALKKIFFALEIS
jgi:hypothetical protein